MLIWILLAVLVIASLVFLSMKRHDKASHDHDNFLDEVHDSQRQ